MDKKRNRILKRLNRQLKNIEDSLKVVRAVKEELEDITKKAEEKKELTGAKEFDDILKDAKKSREKAIQQEEETRKLKEEALKLEKDLE
ncbi:MAG: hypothetical protein C5S38_02545 [Candidatus Methanophagaceae archaeon]|nr:MAG: hypothetical protein C5S38_02545 [Methanophagales archaeon]